jgi:AcrR family transcriptional regulator
MEAVAKAAGVTKPVVYACFAGKEELFEALLEREEARVLQTIQASLPADANVDDPEPLLIDGLTAFLRAVAASPDAYRVIFLGEGATTAIAQRIQRQRSAQVEAVAALSLAWLEGRETRVDAEAAARLFATVVVGLAESGARAMLSDSQTWTPERLGRMLGRMAARGRGVF